MSGFQRYVAVGNLGGDPEIRNVGDKQVAKFRLAISEPWRKGKTLWLSCECWRVGPVFDYMQKGVPILIEGSLEVQEWEKDGQRRQQTVVRVDNITLLGGRADRGEQGERQVAGAGGSGPDDEIPF